MEWNAREQQVKNNKSHSSLSNHFNQEQFNPMARAIGSKAAGRSAAQAPRRSARLAGRPQPAQRPRRPLNGYMRFAQQHRPAIMRSMPGSNMAAVAKVLGSKWRALSDAEKARYNAASGRAAARR
ncbi:hypothetical protein HDE_14462 [Halotydeus destructor]|nr:hypothetical protein HDE_14462 [Halotydeus destructor]